MDIKDLVEGTWDTLALYTLNKTQIKQLLTHPDVKTQPGWMPKGQKFGQHAHGRAQMILVTRGTLTHNSGNMNYTQTPNDVLIIPARLEHRATVGSEELEFTVIVKDKN